MKPTCDYWGYGLGQPSEKTCNCDEDCHAEGMEDEEDGR